MYTGMVIDTSEIARSVSPETGDRSSEYYQGTMGNIWFGEEKKEGMHAGVVRKTILFQPKGSDRVINLGPARAPVFRYSRSEESHPDFASADKEVNYLQKLAEVARVTQFSPGEYPSFPRVLSHSETKNSFFMPGIDGIKLDDILAVVTSSETSFSPEDKRAIALFLLAQSFNKLSALHKTGYAHKDMQMDNILISPETLQLDFIDYGNAAIQPEMTEEMREEAQDTDRRQWLLELNGSASLKQIIPELAYFDLEATPLQDIDAKRTEFQQSLTKLLQEEGGKINGLSGKMKRLARRFYSHYLRKTVSDQTEGNVTYSQKDAQALIGDIHEAYLKAETVKIPPSGTY